MKKLILKKIFIASPGDLNNERNIFKDVLAEVNLIKANPLGYHLSPLGWEDTLPGKGRPQGLINKDLSESDLFLMLLWKRWGSPTGLYSSGTEEEFNVASSLNESSGLPEIWIFFKKEGWSDGNPITDDMNKIISFKNKISSLNFFLWKEYSITAEWEKQFRYYLCKWLDDSPPNIDGQQHTYIPGTNNIYIEITFLDITHGNSRNEIYFTISDQKSLQVWLSFTEEKKKEFLYNNLSTYLYLNIGSNPYKGILRYKNDNSQYILLGLVSFTYRAPIENSTFYLPSSLNQILGQDEPESRLIDLHTSITPTQPSEHKIERNAILPIIGLYIYSSRTYIPVNLFVELLEINRDNVLWDTKNHTLTLIRKNIVVQFAESKSNIIINGVSIETDSEPLIIRDGLTYLLLKTAIQAFGFTLEYLLENMSIKIIWPEND